jgi:hypothetical protein
MLKLSQAISGWRPSDKSAFTDPLALLQAGWRDIVGAEVATNSAPIRVADGILLVVTRSGAWSHQLTFLADQVLSAVKARLPAAGVERLRFRVGSIPKRSSARPATNRADPVRKMDEAAPSLSAGEALARFQRHVETARRAKRSAGWKECKTCGGLIAPSQSEFCGACSAAGRQERALATARLLFEAPWLGFTGTAELVDGLCKEEYQRIRTQLLKRWWRMLEQAKVAGRVSRDGRERLVASSYVVLQSKLSPEEIMPATVRNVLGEELHDLLYEEPRAQPTSGARKQSERRG